MSRSPISGRRPTPRNSKLIVVLLTMLIPGLGHFYAGFLTRGAIWMGGSIALAAVAVSRENDIRDPRLAAMSVALFVVTVADVLTQLRRRDVPR